MGSSAGKEFERVSSTKFSQRLLELNNPGCFLVQEWSTDAADFPSRLLCFSGGEKVVGAIREAALA